jgi:ferredoxin
MNPLDELKESIRAALPDLDMVLAWKRGFDPAHTSPLFITREEEIDKLELSPLNVHNLATYLPGLRGKKVGIVVKGCDSRSVVELLQEKLIDRQDVTLFGLPCAGVVDQNKLKRAVNGSGRISYCSFTPDSITIGTKTDANTLPLGEVLADKCSECSHPNAVLCDHFVGDRVQETTEEVSPQKLLDFEQLTLPERLQFWVSEMDRCIRCYACRNACPLCVCRDNCAGESRDPHWLSQENNVTDKLMFQVMHASHLAGRCTECGECQRACPMDIPILLFKQKMNQEISALFDYKAGVDPEATPPLLSFKVEEDTIHEDERL